MAAEAQEAAVSLPRVLAFCAPVAGAYLMFMPIGIVLQGIYATEFGMALPAIASVFFIARIFDAVVDPLVGMLADYAREHGISRKWWIGVGGIGLIVCSYFLYVPPKDVSVPYFLGWSLAFYLSWAFFDITHNAWGAELSREPTTRNRIFSLRGSMVYIGAIAFYVLPLLPIFDSNEFTSVTLKFAVVMAAIYMMPALLVALRTVPDGHFIAGQHQLGLGALKAMFRNRPFIAFAAIYLLTGLAGGSWLSLTFVIMDRYYGLGESIALMYFLGSFIGIAGLPFWLWLAGRIGKKRSWIAAQLMNVACFLVPLFIAAGPSAKIPLMVATIGIFFSEGCRQSVLPSLLADIVDYGTLKDGADRAATYFSINTLLQKIGIGIGAAAGLMLLSTLGFDPKVVTIGDPSVRTAIVVAFCLAPALIVALSLGFLARFKLTLGQSAIIRRRLDQREMRISQRNLA